MELQIEATIVLEQTLALAKQGKKIILEEGGSRSSKTWSVFQFFLLKALSGEEFTLTIARDKLTWIRDTLIADFEEITTLYNIAVSPAINKNRDDQTYMIGNSTWSFIGLDTPAKLHGKKQDYVWINEAMDVTRKAFDQLEMRTSKMMIIDYNPSDDMHWVFDLQRRSDVGVVRSTMLDNPFLPDTVIRKILSYEPTPENILQGTADQYMWDVYGKGNKARLEGVVYTKWDTVSVIPADAKLLGYGLDFGYSVHPTALIAVYLYNNEIYARELIYQAGLTNDEIAEKMKSLGIDSMAVIFADSSEPKSIEEIRRAGFHNIQPVEKGADSINFGIDILKGYFMHFTEDSINLDREARRYKWAEDRSGKSLGKPIDDFNHALDALRYLAMMILRRRDLVVVLPRFA
jgi:phage terminase large subunit